MFRTFAATLLLLPLALIAAPVHAQEAPDALVKRIAIVVAAVALAAVALLVFVAPRNPEIAVERDVAYGKGGDVVLKLDLAMPKAGDGPYPAIVFLHGEGWRAGNRQRRSWNCSPPATTRSP